MHHSPKMGQKVQYRSSWELQYFRWLDAHPDCVKYEVESLRLPYMYGRRRKPSWYIPDVLVTWKDHVELVEIKPNNFVNDPKVVAKREVAEQYCREMGYVFTMLTEDGLREKGLLI